MPVGSFQAINYWLAYGDMVARKRNCSCLVVLSRRLTVCCASSQAYNLFRRLRPRNAAEPSDHWLPREVRGLGEDLLLMREARDRSQPKEPVSIRRVVAWQRDVFVAEGIAFPVVPTQDSAAILILMERVAIHRDRNRAASPALAAFTPKEQVILRLLAHGHTDKEIATRLGISRWTVKEYVRSLMNKTLSRTRTGVLGRVFGQQGSHGQGRRSRLIEDRRSAGLRLHASAPGNRARGT